MTVSYINVSWLVPLHTTSAAAGRPAPTHTPSQRRNRRSFMQSVINIVQSWQKAHSWSTVRAAVEQVCIMSSTQQADKNEELMDTWKIMCHSPVTI